jgi:hypothetical protein
MRGGSKPGERRGGRQKGTRNKRSKALDDARARAEALIEGTIPGAFVGNAHALLMAIYKDPALPLHVRVDAAKAAIGYEKPRLERKSHEHDVSDPLKALFAKICGTAYRPVGHG